MTLSLKLKLLFREHEILWGSELEPIPIKNKNKTPQKQVPYHDKGRCIRTVSAEHKPINKSNILHRQW